MAHHETNGWTDLKPANIFIDSSGYGVKIGDMNISHVTKGQKMVSRVGTPYYMSPEVLVGDPYTTTCDMWSLGCVVYQMAALVPPFQAQEYVVVLVGCRYLS